VLIKNDKGLFEYDETINNFRPSDDELLREHQIQNSKYRVFIGKSVNADYDNTLYARKLTSVSSNIPLFNTSKAVTKYTKPRVALAIDCLDSADGITTILNCLAKYNLKATFFFNGEFIRRFPNAVQEILNQDHTCASMFYTTFSLDTSDFKIDEEFIRKGLARNEDDFFESTGGELNLIWHAPEYFSNQVLKNASILSGYKFIDNVLDVKDTVSIEQALFGISQYIPTSELIENIVGNAQNGSIIPISSGISEGKRIDYLYDKLDLVLSGLLKRNFDIVTINELE
jgi:peptidoglycan/xylan/chitin deacetylase (PgdA/CDA1 family)